MSSVTPVQFVRPLGAEDTARANVYALLARLFHAAPDEQLLGAMLNAPQAEAEDDARTAAGDALATAWHALLEACRTAFPVLLEQEHTMLFVGTGRAEVTPYLLRYGMLHESDTPLVGLRAQLADWGLARHAHVNEPEDHVAGIFETMRHAIAVQQRSFEEQKMFFDRFVHSGGMAFCSAVRASANARFYGLVAAYAAAFLEVEREAFDMDV